MDILKSKFITRITLEEISSALEQFPVVGLIGPRQCGKTTLAKKLAQSFVSSSTPSIYLDLELPSDLARLSEPELFLNSHSDHLVILDEIQVRPDLFPILRALVDSSRRPGRFLILGSAAPTLIRDSAESLAGRIHYIELTPFSLPEVGENKLSKLWFYGGFPEAFLASSGEKWGRWMDSFLRSYRERDLPLLGMERNPVFLARFFSMLAHIHGNLQNASNLARALGLTSPTISRYLDLLEGSFLLRRLPPLHANLKKRLVKSPKLYWRDSGMLHRILGIADLNALYGHPVVGASYEGFIVEETARQLPPTWELNFYRTHKGAELDLVLSQGGEARIGVEVKHTLAPAVSNSLLECMRDLKLEKTYVVCPVKDGFPLAANIQVITPALYLKLVAELR